jgi:hypothetical protein
MENFHDANQFSDHIPQTERYNSAIPRSTVPSDKLTDPQLIKKSPAIYGSRVFITAITIAHHLNDIQLAALTLRLALSIT